MRRLYLLLLCSGLLMTAVLVGCGDEDECATCPPATLPLGYALGSLQLAPTAVLQNLHVYGYGAVAPNLDSVKVGDSLVSRLGWQMFSDMSLSNAHWAINYMETGDPSSDMYDHGDLATVSIWGEGRSSACQVKILDPMEAMANVTAPGMSEDTLAPGATDTAYWNRVDFVDYYAIMIAFYVTEEGINRWTFHYDYATDTSYIVNGAVHPDSLMYYDVVVTPFNGPNPRTGADNWSGTLLAGKLYSSGNLDYTRIFINQTVRTPGEALSEVPGLTYEMSPAEIVENVYRKYE